MKSKSPSKVGFSIVKYSSICSFTVIAVANHSGPFDIRISVSQEIPIDPNDISSNNLKMSRNEL